jgi:hypothetical protein
MKTSHKSDELKKRRGPQIGYLRVLSVEETEVPEENHQPVASRWQTLSHTAISCTTRHERNTNLQL